MAEKMRHDAITTDKIVSVVKSYKDDILGFFIELSNILF